MSDKNNILINAVLQQIRYCCLFQMTMQCWKTEKWWKAERKVFPKRKTQGFSVSHCRQAKPHAPRLHTQSYKTRALGNQIKEFRRCRKMASVWLTFGCIQQHQGLCKTFGAFPSEEIEAFFALVKSILWIVGMYKLS